MFYVLICDIDLVIAMSVSDPLLKSLKSEISHSMFAVIV